MREKEGLRERLRTMWRRERETREEEKRTSQTEKRYWAELKRQDRAKKDG